MTFWEWYRAVRLTDAEIRLIMRGWPSPWVGVFWMVLAAVLELHPFWDWKPGLGAIFVVTVYFPLFFAAGLLMFVWGWKKEKQRARLLRRLRRHFKREVGI